MNESSHLPWESPGFPLFSGISETTRRILVSPSRAFDAVATNSDLGRPLLYAVILWTLGAMAGQGWNLIFAWMAKRLSPYNWLTLLFLGKEKTALVSLAVTPLLVPVLLFAGAGLLHLFLVMLGADRQGYAGTFRCCCYATAPYVLQVVPLLGGLVALIWMLIVIAIGFTRVHGASTSQAALPVVFSFLFCCGGFAGVVILGGLASRL